VSRLSFSLFISLTLTLFFYLVLYHLFYSLLSLSSFSLAGTHSLLLSLICLLLSLIPVFNLSIYYNSSTLQSILRTLFLRLPEKSMTHKILHLLDHLIAGSGCSLAVRTIGWMDGWIWDRIFEKNFKDWKRNFFRYLSLKKIHTTAIPEGVDEGGDRG
jgi:hypothetical protein